MSKANQICFVMPISPKLRSEVLYRELWKAKPGWREEVGMSKHRAGRQGKEEQILNQS